MSFGVVRTSMAAAQWNECSSSGQTPSLTSPTYARAASIEATRTYVGEVKDGVWPDDEHSFH